MSENHLIKAGEHVPRIAAEKGFADWKTIWEDGKNRGLKAKQRTPCILNPGDSLFIPDKKDKNVGKSTGATHQFKLPANPLKLRLTLKTEGDDPLKSVPYQLKSGEFATGNSTDGAGKVDVPIPAKTEKIDMTLDSINASLVLKVGYLVPLTERAGVMQRLNNLGYHAGVVAAVGPMEQKQEYQLRSAVEEFQCDHSLTVDGKINSKLQDKLKEVYGC